MCEHCTFARLHIAAENVCVCVSWAEVLPCAGGYVYGCDVLCVASVYARRYVQHVCVQLLALALLAL